MVRFPRNIRAAGTVDGAGNSRVPTARNGFHAESMGLKTHAVVVHIAYSEEDAAARIQFAFGHPYPAACLYIFEIHRKKSHPMWSFRMSKGSGFAS